jgi:hypothetical protein
VCLLTQTPINPHNFQGEKGDAGPPGEKGAPTPVTGPGKAGPPGEAGQPGLQGAAGIAGEAGAAGDKGDKGMCGDVVKPSTRIPSIFPGKDALYCPCPAKHQSASAPAAAPVVAGSASVQGYGKTRV